MTPSFLSKKIKKLEKALETKLISRSSKGISLTSEGENFVSMAREIVQKLEEIQGAKSTDLNTNIPMLTIGTRGFLNTALAPVILKHFSNKGLNVNFRFIDMSPIDQMNSAKNDAVDILLSLKETEYGKSWQTERVGDLTWSVYAKKNHPLSLSSHVNIEQVLYYPFTKPVFFDGTSVATINDSIPLIGERVQYGHGVQNTESALAVIMNSQHLTYIPRVATLGLKNKQLISEIIIHELPPKKDPVYLSVHTERVMNKVYKEIKLIISEIF